MCQLIVSLALNLAVSTLVLLMGAAVFFLLQRRQFSVRSINRVNAGFQQLVKAVQFGTVSSCGSRKSPRPNQYVELCRQAPSKVP